LSAAEDRRALPPEPTTTRFLAAMMLALVPGSPAAPGLMLTIPRVLWNQPETCTLQTLMVHYGVLIKTGKQRFLQTVAHDTESL
jgi:hypothetical protein